MRKIVGTENNKLKVVLDVTYTYPPLYLVSLLFIITSPLFSPLHPPTSHLPLHPPSSIHITIPPHLPYSRNPKYRTWYIPRLPSPSPHPINPRQELELSNLGCRCLDESGKRRRKSGKIRWGEGKDSLNDTIRLARLPPYLI